MLVQLLTCPSNAGDGARTIEVRFPGLHDAGSLQGARMHRSLLSSLCLAAAVLFAPAVRAAEDRPVIITSGAQADAGAFSFSNSHWEAIGFRMGATSLYIADVTLRLEADGFDYATLSLFSANPAAPYSVPLTELVQFAPQAVWSRNSYTFTPFGATKLEANELYWLVLRGPQQAGLRYLETPGPLSGDYASPYTSEVGARGHDFAFSEDGGASWTVHSGLNAIEVRGSVTPVPEPSTYLLMLLGGCALVMTARRRRSS